MRWDQTGHNSHVKHVNEAAVDLHRDALWDIPQSQYLYQNKQKRKAGVSVLKRNKHFLKMDESSWRLLKFGNCFILDLKGNRQSSRYHGTRSPNVFKLQFLVATRPPVKTRTTKLLEHRMISSLGQDALTVEWGVLPWQIPPSPCHRVLT